MSGGSYDYIYSKLDDECSGRMYDEELNDMIQDLCKVLKALEWWQSCDTSEESYKKEVAKFKDKWLTGKDRSERLKGYIDKQIGAVRNQLYAMIGEIESEDKKCQ